MPKATGNPSSPPPNSTDNSTTGKPARKRGWVIVRWTIAVLPLLFVGISIVAAVKLTGPMRRAVGSFDEYLPKETERVTFDADDGPQLAGWFAAPRGARRAAILLHGHGSNRRQMLARAGLLYRNGYAVLLYDARGHGESGGERTSVGWYEARDLLGAARFLERRGFPDFGCIGASQGGATIVFAGSRLTGMKWAILESVYPTLRQALDHRFRAATKLPAWLAGAVMIPFAEWRLDASVDRIAPIREMSALKCPVLVAGGQKDLLTPVSETEALYAAAHEPKSLWIVPDAGHVDLYGFAKTDYAAHILEFIAAAEKSPAQSH